MVLVDWSESIFSLSLFSVGHDDHVHVPYLDISLHDSDHHDTGREIFLGILFPENGTDHDGMICPGESYHALWIVPWNGADPFEIDHHHWCTFSAQYFAMCPAVTV